MVLRRSQSETQTFDIKRDEKSQANVLKCSPSLETNRVEELWVVRCVNREARCHSWEPRSVKLCEQKRSYEYGRLTSIPDGASH